MVSPHPGSYGPIRTTTPQLSTSASPATPPLSLARPDCKDLGSLGTTTLNASRFVCRATQLTLGRRNSADAVPLANASTTYAVWSSWHPLPNGRHTAQLPELESCTHGRPRTPRLPGCYPGRHRGASHSRPPLRCSGGPFNYVVPHRWEALALRCFLGLPPSTY